MDHPSSTVTSIHRGTSAAVAAAAGSLDGLPLMLTVEEAAKVLRVSRTTAYKLVQEYRATGGRTGIPHVRLGARVLVRRVDLGEIVGMPQGA